MGDVVDFPVEEWRRTELFRAWKAAKSAGHPNANLIWAEYMTAFVPSEQRDVSQQLLRKWEGEIE